MDPALRRIVLERLEAEGGARGEWSALVLGALGGREAVEALLQGGPAGAQKADAAAALPQPGVYLRALTVEGFRGIGPAQTLELVPGPGLNLVVGRNGSGKSSLAEAFEVLLTGDSLRWRDRAAVWRDGWRNLHHQDSALRATFLAEGRAEPLLVERRWADGAPFETAEVIVTAQGRENADLATIGWTAALRTHRPFLSYNELGSLLDEGPSKLYDALSAILGLEDLTLAQGVLQEARRSREKALKESTTAKDALRERLQGIDHDAARSVIAATSGKEWDLTAVAAVVEGATAAGAGASQEAVLQGIASLEPPDQAHVAGAAAEMRAAQAALQSTAGSAAARSRDVLNLLEQALAFHAAHGDGDCPVCGGKKALDGAWDKRQRTAVTRLKEAAREAEVAHARAEVARRLWEGLAPLKPEALQRASEVGLDLAPLVEALSQWVKAGTLSDLGDLARHVETASGPLWAAVSSLKEAARARLQERDDAWRPVRSEVMAWLVGAREAMAGAAALDQLKAAEGWLKKAAAGIRDDRFEPIAGQAGAIWERLRQQSHVELGRIQLTGDGTRRRVVLDVTVDGVAGAALGVMSQGELHSLALSLFVPRATLPESPFRFIVVDDPVQSMDPARVDGLARVLEGAAKDRQVVVFTHDDRLSEAVRRLDIAADILEVTRREQSVVELRRALDPVGRYLEDALAVAGTASLPASPAAEVVPGLCRLALEAVCMEVVRPRHLLRGLSHGEVERSLGEDQPLERLAALAVFDDAGRAAEVEARLEAEAGAPLAEAFRRCAANQSVEPDQAVELVRRTSNLVAWFRGLP
jgi:energy-coupling factor transporter ATP-binding protein EcfA2